MYNLGRYAALLAAVLLWSCPGDADGSDTPGMPELHSEKTEIADGIPLASRLIVILEQAQSGDLAKTGKSLDEVIRHPDFGLLPAALRGAAHSADGAVAVDLMDYGRARDSYAAAVSCDSTDPDDWYRLSTLELDQGNADAAGAAMVQLLRSWPELLPNLSDEYIALLVNELEPGSERRLELLSTLFDLEWDRHGLDTSHFWFELAVAHVEQGDKALAAAAIKRVKGPLELIKLRSDRRFDDLVEPGSKDFDVVRAAQARVDDLRVQVLLEPERIDLLMELSYAMLMLGAHGEVLTMSEAALALLEQTQGASTPFTAVEDRIWLMNNRSIALRRLGRLDDAVAQLEAARHQPEQDGVNVSQTLNLGQFYCGLGRPAEALAVIAETGSMSGYGRMVQAGVQHCAHARLGDRIAAEKALAHIRANRTDSQITLLNALLETGALDEAAGVLREVLDDPYERPTALAWLQDTLRPDPLPGARHLRERRERLIARSDVQNAVQRVGRITAYAVFADADTH